MIVIFIAKPSPNLEIRNCRRSIFWIEQLLDMDLNDRAELQLTWNLLAIICNVAHIQKDIYQKLFFRPLHEACENGYVEITRLLLTYGADPTLMTYSGLTPLALTNDEITKNFLNNHLNDIEGEPSSPWISYGPAALFGNAFFRYILFL